MRGEHAASRFDINIINNHQYYLQIRVFSVN